MRDAELQELFSLRNEYRSLRYDLANIQALCSELGDPQLTFRSVLVAGTNGKGSVAQWLAGMVDGAGLYISPHLEQLNERISVRGKAIADADLQVAADRVRAAAERAGVRLLYPPTYFERVTAMAFWHFRCSKSDWADASMPPTSCLRMCR
jgi:dihydrofolate synthase / folylpolyglutamate synthase